MLNGATGINVPVLVENTTSMLAYFFTKSRAERQFLYIRMVLFSLLFRINVMTCNLVGMSYYNMIVILITSWSILKFWLN